MIIVVLNLVFIVCVSLNSKIVRLSILLLIHSIDVVPQY